MLGILENVDIHRIDHPLDIYHSLVDDLSPLIASIKQKGLLQPIIIRTKGKRFEIVAGSRRYSACKELGWRKIVCHIVELDDKEAFEVSLVENVQRKTLKPLDEARAFKAYVEDYGWGGISDLATKIGKSVSYVDKRIKLLELPEKIREGVSEHMISTTIAEELESVDDQYKQSELAQLVFKKHLSSRKVRQLVKDYKDSIYNTQGILTNEDRIIDIDEKVQRTFDKTIVTLKLALNRLAYIIEGIEENWVIYEILMQHKNMLNAQIDLLIRQKKKL
jgi:ParB family chromosome partitioning protein